MYRHHSQQLLCLLVHPGGPCWAKRDVGAWSIPKGVFTQDETAQAAARREFEEETGYTANGELIELGEYKQPSGKIIHAFALEGELDAARIKSNTFSMEWPPHSGQTQSFPEVDKGAWFDITTARRKIIRGQLPIIDRLAATSAKEARAN